MPKSPSLGGMAQVAEHLPQPADLCGLLVSAAVSLVSAGGLLVGPSGLTVSANGLTVSANGLLVCAAVSLVSSVSLLGHCGQVAIPHRVVEA